MPMYNQYADDFLKGMSAHAYLDELDRDIDRMPNARLRDIVHVCAPRQHMFMELVVEIHGILDETRHDRD